ncbi:META domain-containing protein [Arthrobacter sp. ATA002]|uniref:META domain-containing protein n=1 Tax=Arthrobacter sp. ATA002 TaxID=2991715 RepID=UPI0022A6C7E1|nr:META domain-containing protein [Arthrobacter sp. ATA002]WAP52148.1 META domain-containing protein [Arthrobacter sp. ATA002]
MRSRAPFIFRRPQHAALMVAAALLATGALASCADSPGSGTPSVEGSWGDTSNSSAPSLDFASDGRVNGTDGCNHMMGSWTQDGSSVVLSDMATTLVACMDVDTWLSAAATAEVNGDTLELFDGDGEPIGTLQR